MVKAMKKILYVSDLDGTLLRSDARISEYTCEVINQLITQGMLFSYATARSYITASKVTKGLRAQIPIITYNGAGGCIADMATNCKKACKNIRNPLIIGRKFYIIKVVKIIDNGQGGALYEY